MIDPELYKKANVIIQRMYKYYFLKDSNKPPGQVHNDLVRMYENAVREHNRLHQERDDQEQSMRRQLDRYGYNLATQEFLRGENEEDDDNE